MVPEGPVIDQLCKGIYEKLAIKSKNLAMLWLAPISPNPSRAPTDPPPSLEIYSKSP